jgi:GT2 family glycosyltransferase
MSDHHHSIRIDAVIVSYCSAATLRDCVEPLARLPHVRVTVIDNASPDDPLATIADLPVTAVRSSVNGGFAYGCNAGMAQGDAPYVLFLNPDASIDGPALDALAAVLDADPAVGLVGPRILDDDGHLFESQRRFPGVATAWGQALFLHRLIARTDEMVKGEARYAQPAEPDWVSGACMLARRDALERIGGMDEGFFLYSEDTDVCKALRDVGYTIRYEPAATARHRGGASAPRAALLPVLARSRARYALKHASGLSAMLQILGIAVGEATHVLARMTRTGYARGHGAALLEVLRYRRPARLPRVTLDAQAP